MRLDSGAATIGALSRGQGFPSCSSCAKYFVAAARYSIFSGGPSSQAGHDALETQPQGEPPTRLTPRDPTDATDGDRQAEGLRSPHGHLDPAPFENSLLCGFGTIPRRPFEHAEDKRGGEGCILVVPGEVRGGGARQGRPAKIWCGPQVAPESPLYALQRTQVAQLVCSRPFASAGYGVDKACRMSNRDKRRKLL